MWKRLNHKNIVPLLAITTTPLQLISEWMSGGHLTEYIGNRPNSNRLHFVGVPPLILPSSYSRKRYTTSLKASTISTPAR